MNIEVRAPQRDAKSKLRIVDWTVRCESGQQPENGEHRFVFGCKMLDQRIGQMARRQSDRTGCTDPLQKLGLHLRVVRPQRLRYLRLHVRAANACSDH